jgi:hypothetical protein
VNFESVGNSKIYEVRPAHADGVTYELAVSITALAACSIARWHRAADAEQPDSLRLVLPHDEDQEHLIR